MLSQDPATIRQEIDRLLSETDVTMPIQSLETLRRARCLAEQSGDSVSQAVAERRLSLMFPADLKPYEEAIACKHMGDQVDYSEAEQRAKRKALQTCTKAFETFYPQYYSLRYELVFTLLHVTSEQDGKPLWAELDRLTNRHDDIARAPPLLSPTDIPVFERGRQIVEDWWRARLAGAPETEQEALTKPTTSPEKAEREFKADLSRNIQAIEQIFALETQAWVWALSPLKETSRLLALAGSANIPDSRAYLDQNIALWANAADRFAVAGVSHAEGIAHLELAIAHRKIANWREALEHSNRAVKLLGDFAHRDLLNEALRLHAEELTVRGRESEAASILFAWVAEYGDEPDLFANRGEITPQSAIFLELRTQKARIFSAVADYLEGEDRFAAAESFRRFAVEVQSVDRFSSIKAMFDLAVNLAVQGKLEEARGLSEQRLSRFSGLIGAALDGIERGEGRAKLAIMLDEPDKLDRAIRQTADASARLSLLPGSRTLTRQALLLSARGGTADALGIINQLITEQEQYGETNRELLWLRAEAARIHLKSGDTEAAISLARQSLPELQR